MTAENSIAALRYLLQDDIYLLSSDKDLYNNPPEQPIAKQTPALTFKYLGGNKKNFLVITCYSNDEFIADSHLKALESTLNRISYTLDDIAIVNKAQHPDADMQQLASFFAPQKLLILGAQAIPAGLPAPNVNNLQTINGCLTLYTYSFDEMMGNKDNTKAFWNQIKTF